MKTLVGPIASHGVGVFFAAVLAFTALAAPTTAEAPATLRRVVILEGEPLAELHARHASPDAMATARAGILAQQSRLKESVNALGGRVLLSWELLTRGAWVEVPAPAVGALDSIHGVARVFAEQHLAPSTSTKIGRAHV